MQSISKKKKKEIIDNMVYTVTKIFGVDAVKTRVFADKKDAKEDIYENITMLTDIENVEVIEKENDETYYIVHRADDPTEFIEFVLRRCEVK
jgi:translation elongation factor EF-1beta